MKKYSIIFLSVGLSALIFTSCLEEYLDKAPESGLNTQDVFSKYENLMLYFNGVYNGKIGSQEFNIKLGYPLYFDINLYGGMITTMEALTDNTDMGRIGASQSIKSGNIGSLLQRFTYEAIRRPILQSMFLVIRKCNTTLQNITLLKDGKQEDIDDLIAQAHLIRAYAHFTLFRWWGRMPYITKVIGPYDQWDIPRLSNHETLIKIAADLDTAVIYFEKAGRMRRDPGPGQVGHLDHPDQYKPNGVAAKAIKARALLYAASPLNNELGAKDWEEAAKANWEAIQIAKQYSYDLMTGARYKENFIGAKYTNEQLWAWYAGAYNYSNGVLREIINGVFSGSKTADRDGESPTQNLVDKFETKWGDPLNSDADRLAAAALNHYNEQDPYKDRDPRFYIDVIYNTAPVTGYGTAKIYYEMVAGAPKYSELLDYTYLGITYTGYYNRKYWGEQSVKNPIVPDYTGAIIRLGELYLNYAEAANEAYGPNTPAPGATMTAVQAINVIRNRIGQADVQVQYTTSKEVFRARVKNERSVELVDEGHYFFDIRRWTDAPTTMSGTIYGMDIEKVAVSPTYPTGYKYLRQPLSGTRQSVWKDAMYYLPFPTDDMFKMRNFAPNALWN
jgi:starch-binding outer membrane protein, SusD/RagB family